MTKTCACCKKEKTLDNFTRRNKKSKDGLCSYCKDCTKEKRRKYQEKRQKEKKRYCSRCNSYKETKDFNKSATYCIECYLKYTKEKRLEKNLILWKKEKPKCYICGNIIPIERFYKSKGNKTYYCSDECAKKRNLKYQRDHKEERNKKYRHKGREYYHNVIKPNKKIYKIPCKFCGNIIETTNNKRRYCCERCRINFYRNKKYKNSIVYKIEVSLRTRINQAIKKSKKSDSTKNLVGCSLDYLKKHLEDKFQPGMTWENYGFYGWHIDHMIPCASFDLSREEEQKKCFHYTNLQPLWAKDNIKKSDKI